MSLSDINDIIETAKAAGWAMKRHESRFFVAVPGDDQLIYCGKDETDAWR